MLPPYKLPRASCVAAPVDLEQVHPSLLLPPHDPAAPQSVLAGGGFEPGDRVVVLRGTGSPPFGSRGTVIGVLPNVVEVLMDNDYAGGRGGVVCLGYVCWGGAAHVQLVILAGAR
jgi:hypothetical protein